MPRIFGEHGDALGGIDARSSTQANNDIAA
jgi:hypothetical protein